MIRWFLLALVVFIVGGLLGWAVRQDPGYVLIFYQQVSVESSLWFMAAIVFTLMISFSLLWTVLWKILEFDKPIRHFLKQRQQRRTSWHLTQGMLLSAAGNWQEAEKHLLKAAKRGDSSLVPWLGASRCAQGLGRFADAQNYLDKAEDDTQGGDLAIGLRRAEIYMAQERWEQALAVLLRLKQKQNKHRHILKLLAAVYRKLGDWEKLIELLPDMRDLKMVSDEEYLQAERQIASNRMEQIVQRRQSSDEEKLEALDQCWKSLPKIAYQDSVLARQYVKVLEENKFEQHALSFLKAWLSKNWDDELVLRYGLLSGDDHKAQLVLAESWLKERPNNSVLLAALARISLRNQLWGKAREYFSSSLSIKNDPCIALDFYRLLDAMGDSLAKDYLDRFIRDELKALPSLPMPSKNA